LTLICFGCNNHDKSKAIIKSVNYKLIGNKNLKAFDSCLIIVNKVIEKDEDYFPAYDTKSTILTKKKDIDGLLENNIKIIELRPNQPIWLIQRGLFFDIKGNTKEAQKQYDLGIEKYEDIMSSDNKMKNDFNFRMEYAGAFEGKGDLERAQKELDKLKKDFPNNEILKGYLKVYKFHTKAELIKIWNNGGEENEVSVSPMPQNIK